MGRPANPRRVADARIQCFRTHGVAASARPTDETVPNLADILREPRRHPGVHLDDDVVVRDESCRRRRLSFAVPPRSALMRAERTTPWAVIDRPASHQPASLGGCFAQHQLRRRARTHFTSGTDPPRSRAVGTCAGRSPRRTSLPKELRSIQARLDGDPASALARVGSFGV